MSSESKTKATESYRNDVEICQKYMIYVQILQFRHSTTSSSKKSPDSCMTYNKTKYVYFCNFCEFSVAKITKKSFNILLRLEKDTLFFTCIASI